MNHIIKKQVIDLWIDQQLDAFNIQHRMSMLCYDEFIPALEKIFDELSDEDTVISIDRLEINLGFFTEKDISDRSRIDQCLSMMMEQLSAQIKFRQYDPAMAPAVRRSKSLSIFRQWLFYMQKGYLPWYASEPDAAWYSNVLETLAADYRSVDELRLLISTDPVLSGRIVLQHSVSFLISLAELLTAKKQAGLPDYIREISEAIRFLRGSGKMDLIVPVEQHEEQMIWKSIFLILSVAGSGQDAEHIARQIIMAYFNGLQASVIIRSRKLTEKIPLTFPAFKSLPVFSPKPAKKSKNRLPGKQEPQRQPENPLPDTGSQTEIQVDDTNTLIPITTNNPEPAKENLLSEPPQTLTDAIREEGIFISNAGIVLLHPFLYLFFRNLHLLSENKFSDNANAMKALCLLHYITTGNAAAAEYELVMAKILCGFPLQAPVDRSIVLSENELKEADDLILELIQRWEILKNTSASGLREGFLQRRGKLYTEHERLHLQMEQHSIDVLLDYLPWNLSVIKLPWMKEHLHVGWR